MFQVLKSVIGKMPRTVADTDEIEKAGLQPGAPGLTEDWPTGECDEFHADQPDGARLSEVRLRRVSAAGDLKPVELSKLGGAPEIGPAVRLFREAIIVKTGQPPTSQFPQHQFVLGSRVNGGS